MAIDFERIRASWTQYRATHHVPVGAFVDSRLRSPHMNLAPDYQRGHVWTRRQSELFVGHIIEGGTSPAFIIHEDWHGLEMEMVDGQQRARALLAWFDGDIEAEITSGERVRYADATETEARMLRFSCGLVERVGSWPRAERLRLYLRINSGGTVHTDAEIRRVREMLSAESLRARSEGPERSEG